ncbi:MAG TPA: 23S rRNA (uracil(1939)-C(5))-methyltransferase RlmD [Candidatus Deferrimicrobium sp.]|nr:23S rRNA (uracil(1939)-C(5))-methyltransferase RlmD [Candidatus Deferrimicrobium sp.]
MGVAPERRLIELEVTDLAFDGKAVAHVDGKVIFLRGGLPGETVEAEIIRSHARYAEGVVRNILKASDMRVKPLCSHFGQCGGCTWQDLNYQQQLNFKRKQVIDCLERIGGLKDTNVHDSIGSAELYGYRNKMEFSFQATDEGFTVGLHSRGRFDDIFDLDKCYLQSDVANAIVHYLRDFVREERLPVYDVTRHIGYMRFLVIRQAKRTGHLMVNIVTNYGDMPGREKLVRGLTTTFPAITTIVHNQNGQKSNIATGEIERVLYGTGYIEERLFNSTFRIRSNSFFQTNSIQTETLYRTAFDMLNPSRGDRVLDLYCGTGSIGILIAHYVNSVVGVEIVADAVRAARENAAVNRATNVTFHHGSVRDFLKALPAYKASYDVIIVDPPRAGMHPKELSGVIELRPKKLLYISCNPATFSRDAKEFVAHGYRLPQVKPIDMFPHTMHIELIGVFYLE